MNTKITVNLTPEFRLDKALIEAGVEDSETVTELTVTGKITDDDIEFIREMMGKTLQVLDMSGATLSRIGESDFEGCTGLTSVIIPDSVTCIDRTSFQGCTGLTTITIPKSVIEITDKGWIYGFDDQNNYFIDVSTSLVELLVHPDNPKFTSENGIVFNKLKTMLKRFPQGRRGDYIIPDSIVKIGNGAFEGCTGLTSIFIPCSVIKIDDCAFKGCVGLTSLTLPSSLIEIGVDAFKDMKASFTVHPDNPFYKNNDDHTKVIPKNDSGTAGTLDWNYTDGVLIFSGEGEIPDYDDRYWTDNVTKEGRSPWYPFSNEIKSIVFKGSIRKKGFWAFKGCRNLSSVTFDGCIIQNYYDSPHEIIDRALSGFVPQDCYNIGDWFPRVFIPMLREHRRDTHGHPDSMTMEEWRAFLDRMIFCFTKMNEDEDDCDSINTYNTEDMKNEGFALLGKYFRHLWS